MNVPLQITFHNMQCSEGVETKIRSRAEKLGRYCDSIVACRVAVGVPHHHHETGNQYRVCVELAVPGAKLVASREPDEDHAYTDVYVGIRDAFNAVRRQLEEYERRRSGPRMRYEEEAGDGGALA